MVQRTGDLDLCRMPAIVMRVSRAEELTCLKAATQFVEEGWENFNGTQRFSQSLTFYERVGELAETVASEWIVAKYLGLDFDPFKVKMKHTADVGTRIEVKWTRHVAGQLIVHEYDRVSDIAVLVTGQTPNYHIRGWIPVAMAQKARYRHTNQPNWWVSQINLQPIENLGRSNYAHSKI